MYYYQVGGLNSHTYQWFYHDTRLLSEFVFSALSHEPGSNADEKKSSAELVLGILSTGASYILITQSQMDEILRFRRVRIRRPQFSPRHASVYASLSPINFESAEELYAKLKTYEQNSRKSRSVRAQGLDTSPANKMFLETSPARSAFEHQRVLWSAIQYPIDISKFGLCGLPSWIASTSFVALTTQVWAKESIEKRNNDPTILAFKLASVRCIAFERKDYASKISHTIRVKIKEHSLMSNGPATINNDAALEIVRIAELGQRLNDFFASIDSKQALLLVYDARQTLSALKKLGVDVSSYETGISTLLYGQEREREQKQEPEPSYSGTWGDYRGARSTAYDSKPRFRTRSRSPKRRYSHARRSRSPSVLAQSDSKPHPEPDNEELQEDDNEVEECEGAEARPPAKVYVIDVLTLFLAVSKFVPGSIASLRDLVTRLGIPVDPNESECRLLIEAWKAMASGKAIDEQHAERAFSGGFTAVPVAAMPNSAPVHAEAADEEVDPNDADPNVSARRPFPGVANGLRPQTNDYDSDDSDY